MTTTKMLLGAFAAMALIPAVAEADSVGVASWYGKDHQGLRTSSGEVFDQEGMTAASKDLPLGARVRVTLHETGRSVVVRVNDRMGAHRSVIDLSRGAARQIGLLGRGRGLVSIDAAKDPVEVADAPDDAADQAPQAARWERHQPMHASRLLVSGHRAGHAASFTLARHVVDRRPARHRL